ALDHAHAIPWREPPRQQRVGESDTALPRLGEAQAVPLGDDRFAVAKVPRGAAHQRSYVHVWRAPRVPIYDADPLESPDQNVCAIAPAHVSMSSGRPKRDPAASSGRLWFSGNQSTAKPSAPNSASVATSTGTSAVMSPFSRNSRSRSFHISVYVLHADTYAVRIDSGAM